MTSMTSMAATELGQAVYELVGHQIDLHEFARRFLASRVYTLCPVRPGLFVMSRPGGAAIVPVWSTVRALRQVTGNCDWLARTGRDLAARMPAGVDLLIDDGMPCPIALTSAVLLETHLVGNCDNAADIPHSERRTRR
jgi:hypothetical protein